MLQEMHHRVRNNLQTISALLAMQQRRLEQSSSGAEALRDSVARIQSIAAVHNLLCREDVGVTTVDAVVRQIVEGAQSSLVSPDRPIRFEVIGEPARVDSREATVLAIVLNELIVNAMSHGLTLEGGKVVVETTRNDEMITVEVRDDGPSHGPFEPSGPSSIVTPCRPSDPGTRILNAGRKITSGLGADECRVASAAKGVNATAPKNDERAPPKKRAPST